MTEQSLLPDARRLRGEGLGYRRIGAKLGISKDAAGRLIKKIELADARSGVVIDAGNAVALYDAACQALAKARTLIEVKDVADRMSALKEFGRLAKDRALEIEAAELRIRAERRLGEMLAAANLKTGPRPVIGSVSEPITPTLADLDIDKKLSMRAQRLADLPESALENRIAQWRGQAERGAGRVTINLLRDGDKKGRRAAREAELGKAQAAGNLTLPAKRYGVILADPEWRFEPFSRETGMDRAPENHYPTSITDSIAARPVAEIAADDCVLFLWATVPMLPDALRVMAAWGFAYRSNFVWAKDRIGTGYWNRNKHDHLLIGVKGNIPAPAMGTQWESVLVAAVRDHSEKPDWQYELIEAYFPTLPKIELNARRAHAGWDAWGLDAPSLPQNLEAAE